MSSTNSLYFDGNNEVLNIGNLPVFDFDMSDSFSLSAWVAPNPAQGWTSNFFPVISKMQSSGQFTGWVMAVGNTGVKIQLVADLANYIDIESNTGVNGGGWKHIVFTYSGSGTAAGCSIYINNVLQTNVVVVDTYTTGSMVNSINMKIASRNMGANDYRGWMDDVAVYSEELNASDVDAIYNNGVPGDLLVDLDDGYLEGYWKMGDGDAGIFPTITDHSANGNDGTLINMVVDDITTEVPGLSHQSAQNFTFETGSQFMTQQGFNKYQDAIGANNTGGAVVNYRMRALQSPGPGYHYWIVQGAPDFAGANAPGAIQAGSAVILTQWTEE